nr:hypothetical protein [uncultured Capnocytophaga sp.]
MNKSEQFSKIIDKFEEELINLQSALFTYQKIEDLSFQSKRIIEVFEENIIYLKDISKKEEQQQERVSNFLLELEKKQESIAQKQQRAYDDIKLLFSEIREQDKDHKCELSKTLDTNFETISRNNKDFYRDVGDTLRIKLEDHKAEIKRMIEAERVQIREMIEKENQKSLKEQKNIKILLYCLLGLVLLLFVFSILK